MPLMSWLGAIGLSASVSRRTRQSWRHLRRGPQVEALEARDVPTTFITPGFIAHPDLGSGPTGYTPAEIRQAYGFNQISFNGTTGDGRGTTIAIVDAYNDPNLQSDLQTFDSEFSLPNPVLTQVNQTGGTTLPAGNVGWAEEISLDVEWAHAIAPGANILLVEATNSSTANLYTAAAYAAKQPGVVAVSMSWGGSEYSGETSQDSTFLTPAGHTGVVFVASSGDSGAPVSYPAASPNVLSVGGTTLNLNSQGGYLSETGWSGSGGGISQYESQPAYQKGVVTQSTTNRTNPDVAYDANPNTGFPVYDSYGTQSAWMQFGGTSDAAPQWAALIAIADQGRAAAGESALSSTTLLPAIYQLPAADFHDITSGTSDGSPSYSAGPGYDLVTGRGSPIANLVVAGLVGTPINSGPVATHFTVTAPSTATAGTAFSITVTALAANNQTVTGYTGTVQLTSSDPAAGLPTAYTFTSADAGSHTFSITLKTAGSQTITATDTSSGSITGSATVTVSAAAVSGFQVTGFPSPATAGVAGTFTVTAVDSYGNPLTSYSGTVHFTSSDPKAILPANASITAGKGTFSATFETAGTESLTVTDTSHTTMTGTLTGILVNPGAATHLAFLHQPTTSPAGSAISPAVTVVELDAFNNVVTTDNSDQVSLALATNPADATLTGGGPVTFVHGVATFTGVSISAVGTGDTLAASSGKLTGATSGAFNVTTPIAGGTVIENFQNGLGNYWYEGYSYPLAYISAAAAHESTSTHGLDDPGDGDWYFRTDAAAQVHPGDTISAWVQLSQVADGRAYFGFGTTFNGTDSVVLAPNTGQFLIQNNAGFGFTNLAAANQTYQPNQWYRVEVDWGTSGTVVAKLFASDGQTLLNSVTVATGDTTPGGFAFRSTGFNTFFDTVTVSRGVNDFALAAPTTGSGLAGGTTNTPAFAPPSTRSATSGAGEQLAFSAVPSRLAAFLGGASVSRTTSGEGLGQARFLTDEWFVEVG